LQPFADAGLDQSRPPGSKAVQTYRLLCRPAIRSGEESVLCPTALLRSCFISTALPGFTRATIVFDRDRSALAASVEGLLDC
jgi:hypothetical protein